MQRLLISGLLALGLLWSAPSWAAIAFVNNVAAGSTTGDNVTTGAIDNTGANFLVCAVGYKENITITVTDSSSNTWTGITKYYSGASLSSAMKLYYVANATVSAAQTFTVTSTGGVPSIECESFSGVSTSSPLDVETGAGGTTVATIQPGSVTPSQNNTLLVTAFAPENLVSAISVNLSFTLTNTISLVGGQHYGSSMAYLLLGTAAATNPAWSWTTNSNVGAAIAVFKSQASVAVSVSGTMGGQQLDED